MAVRNLALILQNFPFTFLPFFLLGQWLYRNPATHIRCNKFLERMMDLKASKFMDPMYSSMVDNAYFMCKPPTTSASVKVSRARWILQILRSSPILSITAKRTCRSPCVHSQFNFWPPESFDCWICNPSSAEAGLGRRVHAVCGQNLVQHRCDSDVPKF